MKTNLADLMNKIQELENQYFTITNYLKQHMLNTKIEELDGRINIIEDNQENFQKDMKDLNEIIDNIIFYKNILYQKNNSFKLSDGRSIQTAIIENKYLRRKKEIYTNMLENKNSKKRCTEVNNSYFEITTTNFDAETIKDEIKKLTETIQKTDFEISKLNSQEFEI